MNAMSGANRRVVLRLFIAGATPSAEKARHSLQTICDDLRLSAPAADVELQVVDILTDPDTALLDQVFATPTVIRVSPGPARRLFGDLSSPEMVMIGLQLAPEAALA